ncbi:hypothetical protein ABZ114_15130 [Streptomyces albidoflavus]|uniref:hypothetical protein n=1 Tax=Streptomyces TaxID=1883 RepID=UPI00063ECE93|nr:hypothetical protein [Streptomyces sp. KE1]KLJ01244.1 hypothetical protein WQ59_14150 [Streptomyces sp. KE1]
MKHGLYQVLGMALLVVGAQGAIRQLVDHDDAGLLGWLPGGFAASITAYVLAVLIGAIIAGRAHETRRTAGS